MAPAAAPGERRGARAALHRRSRGLGWRPIAASTGQVDVDGVRVAYERAGDGPPVVLLHGFVGDGGGTWRHQLDALSDEFTVIAWDAPGAGRSSDPPESFRMPDYADCLAGFVDALGLRRAHLVGLSFGGSLALEVLRRHPALPMSDARRRLRGMGGLASRRRRRTPPAAEPAAGRRTAR